MASVFWDAEGILFIEYLETAKTTGEYYSNLLTRLDEENREKRPGLQKKKIIFHQDSPPAHKSVLAMGKLRDPHYELLEHPPYSPDLAFSDCVYLRNSNSSSLVSVFSESRGDCSCRGVFNRSYEEPLQGRDNGARASLE